METNTENKMETQTENKPARQGMNFKKVIPKVLLAAYLLTGVRSCNMSRHYSNNMITNDEYHSDSKDNAKRFILENEVRKEIRKIDIKVDPAVELNVTPTASFTANERQDLEHKLSISVNSNRRHSSVGITSYLKNDVKPISESESLMFSAKDEDNNKYLVVTPKIDLKFSNEVLKYALEKNAKNPAKKYLEGPTHYGSTLKNIDLENLLNLHVKLNSDDFEKPINIYGRVVSETSSGFQVFELEGYEMDGKRFDVTQDNLVNYKQLIESIHQINHRIGKVKESPNYKSLVEKIDKHNDTNNTKSALHGWWAVICAFSLMFAAKSKYDDIVLG